MEFWNRKKRKKGWKSSLYIVTDQRLKGKEERRKEEKEKKGKEEKWRVVAAEKQSTLHTKANKIDRKWGEEEVNTFCLMSLFLRIGGNQLVKVGYPYQLLISVFQLSLSQATNLQEWGFRLFHTLDNGIAFSCIIWPHLMKWSKMTLPGWENQLIRGYFMNQDRLGF